jgi:hypothetical protein
MRVVRVAAWFVLLAAVVTCWQDDGEGTEQLDNIDHESGVSPLQDSPATSDVEWVKSALSRLSDSAATTARMKQLGESLGAKNEASVMGDTVKDEVSKYAKELHEQFLEDATGVNKQGEAKFDALVASVSAQIKRAGPDESVVLAGLIKQAVQSEVLKRAGAPGKDGGDAADSDVPSLANGAAASAESVADMAKLHDQAEERLDKEVAGEVKRREEEAAASRVLEIQKAQERLATAKAKVAKLEADEESQHKQVAKLSAEEEKLREEASEAHAAASARQVADIVAKKKADKAYKLAQLVIAAQEKVDKLKDSAKVVLQSTMAADKEEKIAREATNTFKEQLEASKLAKEAIEASTKSAVDKVHTDLAGDIAEKNEAKDAITRAEADEDSARKAEMLATTPAEQHRAESALVAAKEAKSRAELALRTSESLTDSAVKVAGLKKKNAAMKQASAEAAMMSTKGQLESAKIKAAQAADTADKDQAAATKLALEGTAQAAALDDLRRKATEAAREAAEARRMTSPTVAKEVATKKAIAVASTEFVKRQAAAKALELSKRKKVALQELQVIEAVTAKIKAEASSDSEKEENDEIPK